MRNPEVGHFNVSPDPEELRKKLARFYTEQDCTVSYVTEDLFERLDAGSITLSDAIAVALDTGIVSQEEADSFWQAQIGSAAIASEAQQALGNV